MKDRPYPNKTYRFQFYTPLVVLPVPTLMVMALTMLRTLMTTTMVFWMWMNVAEPAGTLCKQQQTSDISAIPPMQKVAPEQPMQQTQQLIQVQAQDYCFNFQKQYQLELT